MMFLPASRDTFVVLGCGIGLVSSSPALIEAGRFMVEAAAPFLFAEMPRSRSRILYKSIVSSFQNISPNLII